MHFQAILSNYIGMRAYIYRRFIPTTAFLVIIVIIFIIITGIIVVVVAAAAAAAAAATVLVNFLPLQLNGDCTALKIITIVFISKLHQ